LSKKQKRREKGRKEGERERKGKKELELSCIVDGNAKRFSHFRKQCASSLQS
jgi:hypothetical protein